MRLITRNTDYAMRSLCSIARHAKEVVSVSELAKELKIPRPFLRKILQVLNREGIVKSYKGKGGGFVLALSPNKIFLADLIRIFQGPTRIHKCFIKKMLCPDVTNCLLKERIDSIENHIAKELNSITIASLLNGRDERWRRREKN